MSRFGVLFTDVYRYIELNPVHAHMADHPTEYSWPSNQHNAADKAIRLITPHPSYLALGIPDAARKAN